MSPNYILSRVLSLCWNILILHYKVNIWFLLGYHDYVLRSRFMVFYFWHFSVMNKEDKASMHLNCVCVRLCIIQQHCRRTKYLDTIECINGEQLFGWDFVHAQDESKSAHFEHPRRHIFTWHSPYSKKSGNRGEILWESSCDDWGTLFHWFPTRYGSHQAKMCLQACAKCIVSDSSHSCAKSHLGICSPLIHSIVSNDSVSRQQRPSLDCMDA